MIFYKKIILFIILHLFLKTTLFASCIGVITASGGKAFWDSIHKGAIKAGKELDIPIYVRGLSKELDTRAQNLLIKYMVKKGCTGLVLAPNSKDKKAIVTQLKNQSIPTVFIDRDIGGDRISVIKTNNLSAGKLAGQEMVKALKGKGKVAILRLDKNILTTTTREKGFIEEAIKGGLEIVVDTYIGTSISDARKESKKIFKEIKNIDGVFTPNEFSTMGTMVSLMNLKKAGSIVHIGFDSNQILMDALKSNNIHGLVVQQPFQIGYQGVYTVYKAMREISVKDNIEIEASFIKKF